MPIYSRTYLAGVLLVCLFLSCRKEKSLEEYCTYAPYSTGASYTYHYSNGQSSFNFHLAITGDTIIGDHMYYILNSGGANVYLGCYNGQNYQLEAAINTPSYVRPQSVRTFLFDSYAINRQWADTVPIILSGTPYTTLTKYKIIKKGETMTVMGRTYQNVIGVREEGYMIINGTEYDLGTIGNFYYASYIGPIETDTPTDTTRLVSITQ